MNFGGPYAHAFDILRWELGWIAFKTYSVVALIYGLLTVGGTLGIFVLLQVADRRQALLVVGGTTVGPVLGGLLLGERYDASPVIAGAVAVIVASAGLTTLVATLWPSAFALQKAMALPEGGAVSVSSEAGTTLPEPQNRVMEYIRSHNFAVSQSQMANDLGYSTEEVDRALQWLGDQNFLR